MNEIRQKLKQKYGDQLLSVDLLNKELQNLVPVGSVENTKNLKLGEKMDVDTFIDYINVTNRNKYLSNCSVFQDSQEMDDDLYDACATVSDFIEDDKLQSRMEILNDVVQKYVKYEKKIVITKQKGKITYITIITLFILFLFWLLYPEQDPY